MRQIFPSIRSRRQRMFLLLAALLIILPLAYLGSIFTIYKLAGITSSNAVVYYVRDHDGKLHVSNDDLLFSENDELLYMIDMTGHFRLYQSFMGWVLGSPMIETTWDGANGHGILKETRPDGTKFLVILARHVEQGKAARGIFLGGDLTYVDQDRLTQRTSDNTGMAYYDGTTWRHVWCTINEGLMLQRRHETVHPTDWQYLGSTVVTSRTSEVVIESRHRLAVPLDDGTPVELHMNRTIRQQAGSNYVLLKVEFHNAGRTPLAYDWSFGDEPWVGEFGSSAGDVGWSDDGVHLRSGYLSPLKHRYAGYWDVGNELAGEPKRFSGYANFIEWLETPPTVVYFSNGFVGLSPVKEGTVLNSPDNRVINLLWRDQVLRPEERRAYLLALGMTAPGPAGLPSKPSIPLP